MKRQLIHKFVMFSLGLCLSLVLQGTCINYPSVAIPDGDQNGVSNTILNTGSMGMLGAETFLTEVCLLIKHPKLDDIDILLTSPSGTTIELSTDNGGSFADYGNALTAGMVCFSPLGVGGTILGYLGGSEGEFSPESPFSLFNGEDPNGAWTLTVADDDPFFTGFLLSWSIAFSDGDCFKDTGDNPVVPIQAPEVEFSGLDSYYCSDNDLVLLVGEPLPTAAVVENYTLSGAGFQIIDGSSSSISSSTISVSEFEEGAVVYTEFAVEVSVNISHSWVGDLIIQVVSPCGNVIDLIDRPGAPPGVYGSGSDMIGTYTFTNAASFLFPEDGVGQNAIVPNGDYLPADSFAELLGCELNGDWTLIIQDPILGGSGFVIDWQLNVTLDQPATTGVFLGGGITNLGNGTAYFDPGLANIDPVDPNVILYTYTHTNGLSYTEAQEVIVYQTPQLAPIAPLEICGMGPSLNLADYQTADVYGQAGTYLWFQDSTLTMPLINPVISDPGTYWLQFTSEYDCPTKTSIVVTQLPDPIATIAAPPTYCVGDVASLQGASLTLGTVILYEWTGPSGFTSDQATITNLTTAGLYELRVIVDDCISFPATHNLVINSLPEPTFSNPFTVICPESATQTYSLEGAYSNYDWVVTGGTVVAGGTPNSTVTVEWDATAVGSINVTVIDGLGCQGTAELLVEKNPTPTLSFGNSASEFCTGYPVTFMVDSGFASYQWSSTAGIVQTSPTGADSLVVSFGAPGMATITVNVADDMGCVATAELDVMILDDLLPELVDPIVNVCIEDDGVVYTLSQNYLAHTWTVQGGTIDGDSTTNSISVDWGDTAGPGMVSVFVEVDNGCSGSLDLPVELLTPPPFSFVGDLQACEGSTGNLYTATGAFTSYAWSVQNGTIIAGGQLADDFVEIDWDMNGALTGIISLNVTDQLSCTLVNEYEVEIVALPKLDFISSTDSTVCAFDEELVYTLDGSAVDYAWTVIGGSIVSGGTTTDSTVTVTWDATGAGLIEVNYSDAAGCSSSTALNVEVQNYELPFWQTTTTELCDSTQATYELGTAYDSYEWIVEGGTIVSGGTAADQSITVLWGDSSAVLTANVSMANGCSGSLSEDVELFNPPTAILEMGADTVCASEQNVPYVLTAGYDSYNIVVLGGTLNQDAVDPNNFTIDWSDLASGQISAEISNAQGCLQQMVWDVVINPAPEFTILGNDLQLCFGGSTQMIIDNPTTDVVYTWEPAGLVTTVNPEGTAVTVEALNSDTEFTVTATDLIGCTFEASYAMDVLDELVITGTLSSESVCAAGDSLILTANGAAVYELTPMDGVSTINANSFSLFPTVTTTYQLIGTDNFGCIDTIEVEVGVFEPAVIATMDSLLIGICEDVTLMPSVSGGTGAMTYAWSPIDGLSATDELNPIADPETTTTYTLILTDEKGCSAEAEVTVEVIGLPEFTISANEIELCFGGSTRLSVDNPADDVVYTWAPANLLTMANAQGTEVILEALDGDTEFTATATDTFGCTFEASYTVAVRDELIIEGTLSNDAVCTSGDSIVLTANGADVYELIPMDGASAINGNSYSVFPASTTIYQLIGTDSFGCIDTIEVEVEVFEPAEIAPMDIITIGICEEVTLMPYVSGGTGLMTYEWSPATGLSADNVLNPIADPETTTTYNLILTDEKGCSTEGEVTVEVIDLPVITIAQGSDIHLCPGSTTVLVAQGGDSYSWSGDGIISQDNDEVTISLMNSAILEVIGTDEYGCSSTASVNVEVSNNLTASVSMDQVICFGESVQLFAGGGGNFDWFEGAGLDDDSIFNPTATPNETTTYKVVVWEGVGCIDTAEVTVTVLPLPILEVGQGGTICEGEVFQIAGSQAENYDKIFWQSSGTGVFSVVESLNPIYTPSVDDEGEITLEFTLESQCGTLVKYVDIFVDRPSLEVELTQDVFQICEGESIDLEAFQNESSTTSWTGGTGTFSQPTSMQTSFTPTTTGVHELYFNAVQNCEAVQIPVLLDVLPVYELTASETQNIVYGEEVQLNVFGDPNESYLWSPSEGLSCDDCPSPMASPEGNTIYTVSSTTSCTVEASVNVFVNTDVKFLVPTAFSPNGDGVNDVLKVFGGAWELETFSVFNRYGQAVFQSKDNSGWDGTFKGEMQEAGVYVVVAQYISRIDGRPSIYKGNVTLIH